MAECIRLNPNVEDMQRLVERMARAKWITGDNMVSPEHTILSFTPTGRDKMRQLRAAFLKYVPMGCLPPKMCIYDPHSPVPSRPEEVVKLMDAINPILKDLAPFTVDEWDTFSALIFCYARQEKDPLAGHALKADFEVKGMEKPKPPAVINANDFPLYMQGVVERLARLKWIEGPSVVTSTSTALTFTALGREQMQTIRGVFRDIEAMYAKTPSGATIEGEPGMTPDDYARERFIEDVSHISAKLRKPQLSAGEELMVRQLLWCYTRMEPDPLAEGPAKVNFPVPSLTIKSDPDKKGKTWYRSSEF